MPEETVLPAPNPVSSTPTQPMAKTGPQTGARSSAKTKIFHRATNASAAKCTMQTPLSLSIQTQ